MDFLAHGQVLSLLNNDVEDRPVCISSCFIPKYDPSNVGIEFEGVHGDDLFLNAKVTVNVPRDSFLKSKVLCHPSCSPEQALAGITLHRQWGIASQ
jgi:hypothetical protein